MNIQNKLTGIFLSVALLSLSACGSSPQVKTGLSVDAGASAYKSENYQDAYDILLPHAEASSAEAQYAVGYLLFYGRGVPQDKTMAIDWFKKAAGNGDLKAIDALAILIDNHANKAEDDAAVQEIE